MQFPIFFFIYSFLSVAAIPSRKPTKPIHPTHGRTKVVLTNDDGWAVAQVRAEYDALKAAGFKVVLSAPAENKSGTGSSTAPPTVLNTTCEFNTCDVGSPAEGFNASDPFLNYVNSFPVDAVRFGIQTLAPKLLGSKPDFVVSGSNVGNNLGSGILGSGTVGAACEAALEGVPSIAFSGASVSQVSYTTLTTNATSPATVAALLYTRLTLSFIAAFLKKPGTLLPNGVSINVNYPVTNATHCADENEFKWVLTRIVANPNVTDVRTCGSDHLPDETSTVRGNASAVGCFVSVSVFNATTKADVGAETQGVVEKRLNKFLSCLPGETVGTRA